MSLSVPRTLMRCLYVPEALVSFNTPHRCYLSVMCVGLRRNWILRVWVRCVTNKLRAVTAQAWMEGGWQRWIQMHISEGDLLCPPGKGCFDRKYQPHLRYISCPGLQRVVRMKIMTKKMVWSSWWGGRQWESNRVAQV